MKKISFDKPLLFLVCLLLSCQSHDKDSLPEKSISDVMDDLVSRFYNDFDKNQLDTISDAFVLHYLNEEEKQVFSTKYWNFEVNVPVNVSLMRDKDQQIVPFWLTESGFQKTELEVKNFHSTYEVWQKTFDAGPVNLGITGFDKHRPVYFLSVGSKNQGDQLEIHPVFPSKQHFETMEAGAFTYHDWDGLTLTEVPESLQGQKLLTTIRGRAREAHLIEAFRETKFPSSNTPDQVMLTWHDDPKSSIAIQWRTDPSIENGKVRYWKSNSRDTLETRAEKFIMEDRLLANDRYIHRFTASLSQLEAGTEYFYKAGKEGNWSETASFTTQTEAASPFSFVWFGDVHNSEIWGGLIQDAHAKHPGHSFYMIGGDLVNTGLYRNDWDELFQYAGRPIAEKPLMTVPGNHDSQDGLGAWMYKEMFHFPTNGPSPEMSEMTYSFHYQNAHFIMIDATFPIEKQTAWIENELSSSPADWKFVMFHFPPYNAVEPYDDIVAEWGPIFDKYSVDMVMGGHFHYYMRSHPIHNGKIMSRPEEGPIYVISIGTKGKNEDAKKEAHAAVQFAASHLYQHVEIDGNQLKYTTYDLEGKIRDQFTIHKK